jgi:hypothetical protein
LREAVATTRGVFPVDWGGDIEAIGEFGERWDR